MYSVHFITLFYGKLLDDLPDLGLTLCFSPNFSSSFWSFGRRSVFGKLTINLILKGAFQGVLASTLRMKNAISSAKDTLQLASSKAICFSFKTSLQTGSLLTALFQAGFNLTKNRQSLKVGDLNSDFVCWKLCKNQDFWILYFFVIETNF